MSDATLKQWIETSAEELADQFEALMSTRDGTFAERERSALRLANEIVRRWTQRELVGLGARYGEEVSVDGQRYRRHASGTRKYHSLCGSLDVRRDTYRLVGIHNGPTVVPLELEAGILENSTPALVSSVVQAYAQMPLRHYEDEMGAAHRQVPSRSTLERIGKRTATQLRDELPAIEPIVRSHELLPEEASSISVGLDRTTMPMSELSSSCRSPKTTRHVRRRPPPTSVAYRMAYVATVAVNDVKGETIRSTRISATAQEGPVELMERLGAELQHLLAQRPSLPILVIQDGAPELWNLMNEWLPNFGIAPAMRLIDRFHVEERLAQTAEIIEPDRAAAHRLLNEWRAMLNKSDRAVPRIRRQIGERLFARLETSTEVSEGVLPWPIDYSVLTTDGPSLDYSRRLLPRERSLLAEATYGYLRRGAGVFRYATARRRGFPVGSGVTEGACKSVVTSRFKRSGQRWFEYGASCCLQLRTLHLNERLSPSVALLLEKRREQLRWA